MSPGRTHRSLSYVALVTSAIPLFLGLSGVFCCDALAAPFIYAAVTLDDKVAVIDTANDTVLTSIPVPHLPVSIATNDVGNRVYVGSAATSNVSVIDTLANAVIDTIAVAHAPVSMAYVAANQRLYVSDDAGIAVIDTTTNALVSRINGVGTTSYCDSIAASHAGNRIYMAGTGEHGNGYVWVIDTSNDSVVASVPVFSYPCAVAVAPDDSAVYVTPGNNPQIPLAMLVLHTADNSVNSTGFTPNGWDSSIVLNSTGTRMYIPSGVELLQVVDPATGELKEPMLLAPPAFPSSSAYAYGAVIVAEADKLYVADSDSNTVSVGDLKTQLYLHAVTVGYFPNGLAVVSIIDKIFKAGFD